ncbi:MAG: diaminopimelate epimerase [Bacteroidota bacterium]|nr:diaminopimelate epimerase [Bacteroidota bacterium]
MNITFRKYQGTGNDFIIIDDRNNNFPQENRSLIETLCNRRFGIGADGLILLQNHADGDFYMQYFNSDGNESSMCGNGGRCIAQFAFDQGIAKNTTTFYAVDGIHTAKSTNGTNNEKIINLQMCDVGDIEIAEESICILNTGSPHYVSFKTEPVDTIDLVNQARLIRYNDEYKEKGINVNFVNLKGLKSIAVRTYERGVEDETFSCGTGATASALATAIFNNLPGGMHQINVNVKGGDLKVQFNFEKNPARFTNVWLQGPAVLVFQGSLNIDSENI